MCALRLRLRLRLRKDLGAFTGSQKPADTPRGTRVSAPLALFTATLATLQRVLGPGHPDTQDTAQHLHSLQQWLAQWS